MTAYAVMKMDVDQFKKGEAYEITDRDESSLELDGDDEWVEKSQIIFVTSSEAKDIIANHYYFQTIMPPDPD